MTWAGGNEGTDRRAVQWWGGGQGSCCLPLYLLSEVHGGSVEAPAQKDSLSLLQTLANAIEGKLV